MKEILRYGCKTMWKLHETVVGTMSKDLIGFHGSSEALPSSHGNVHFQ